MTLCPLSLPGVPHCQQLRLTVLHPLWSACAVTAGGCSLGQEVAAAGMAAAVAAEAAGAAACVTQGALIIDGEVARGGRPWEQERGRPRQQGQSLRSVNWRGSPGHVAPASPPGQACSGRSGRPLRTPAAGCSASISWRLLSCRHEF
eukprot:16095-Pelagomonas_calceolata.AAC.1